MDILKKYDIEIIRSDRRTVALEVRRDLSVVVRAPRRMPRAEILRFVESEEAWIEPHIALMRQKILAAEARRAQAPRFTDAEIRGLAERALERIPPRVAHFAPLVGVTFGRMTVRAQRTRWGSCSSSGNLNFNCLLALVPPAVLDYVVVHELCHRKVMNHSDKFYAEVLRAFPHYHICNKWLKENGDMLIMRMAGNL